ncbi:MAG: hypothetical protein LBO06_08445 [Bacteroidales bacterium]|jgi:hypothetical protein|nr:hypothetical protein [Bacteroidales bacterium]
MKTLKMTIIVAFASVFCLNANAQTTPNKTETYGLFGYPSLVRYMKYEADTATNIKQQRTAFIDDYQLTFNDRRELLERLNFINEAPDRKITLSYNNKRQVTKEVLTEVDGKIVSTTDYEYGYLGRLSQITISEYPLSRAGANTVVYKESYDYNAKGQLTTQNVFANGETLSKITKYFYGPQDSLIYTTTTYSENKNVDKITYRRDFKHDVIEMTAVRNDKQTRREAYELNDKAKCVVKKVFNAKDKLILTYTYEYDQHGNVLSEVAINDRNVRTIDYYYKYEKDSFFNWVKRTMYDGWLPKYVETRKIEYIDKPHFYDDLKDEDTKRVIRQ